MTIQEFKTQVTFREIFQNERVIKKGNQTYLFKCPFCGHSGCFTFTESNNTYNCFSCGNKGDKIRIKAHLENKTEEEFIKENFKGDGKYMNNTNMKLNNSIFKCNEKSNTRKKININLQNLDCKPISENSIAYNYCISRKITKETLEAFRINEDSKNNILFPFYENGIVKLVKARISRKFIKGSEDVKTWCINKDKNKKHVDFEAILYNLNNLDLDHKQLVICEGEFDCMILQQCGIKNAVSISTGTQNLEWINFHFDLLNSFEKIIIIGDNDEAGQKLNSEVTKRLGVEKVLHCEYKEDINDINELYFKKGEEGVRELVENAVYTDVDGYIDIADVEIQEITEENTTVTGINHIDRYLGGLIDGGLTILTGKRGSGKSTFIGQIATNITLKNKQAIGIYSGELTAGNFKNWIYKQIAGISQEKYFDKVRNIEAYRVSKENINKIDEEIRNLLFLYDNSISDRNKNLEETSILRIFEYLYKRFGVKIFIVDNLMSLTNEYAMNKDLYRSQGEFVGRLKTFCRNFGVHILLCCHPRKSQSGNELANDDVSGSSQITDYADSVITITRISEEEKEENSELAVCDNLINITKNRQFGDIGVIKKLAFEVNSKRFIELDNSINQIHQVEALRKKVMPVIILRVEKEVKKAKEEIKANEFQVDLNEVPF